MPSSRSAIQILPMLSSTASDMTSFFFLPPSVIKPSHRRVHLPVAVSMVQIPSRQGNTQSCFPEPGKTQEIKFLGKLLLSPSRCRYHLFCMVTGLRCTSPSDVPIHISPAPPSRKYNTDAECCKAPGGNQRRMLT